MGAVYLAEDQRLPTSWALKEMKKEGLSEEERAEAVELFQSEARLLSELRHRNLPRIVDFFEQESQLYLVMDFVEGETLEARYAKTGALGVNFALELSLQLADVLDYLHTRPSPVVFRDFKPGNVMLTPNDEVKLIDFGIARVFKEEANKDTKALGTPGYAAPEQYGRGQSGPRTDLYAFAATMHHMLSGRDPTSTPFQFPSLTEYRQDLPPEYVALIDSCLNLKIEERPDSAFALKRVLEQLLGKTGSAALAGGRATTTHLNAEGAPPPESPSQPAPQPPTQKTDLVPSKESLPGRPQVSFSPKSFQVKELSHGDKATLRLRVKTDRSVALVPNSPHLAVFPDRVGPGSATVTVSLDSKNLDKGSVFSGAIEVDDIDDLAMPVEARIGDAKASASAQLGMYTLCLLTLIPLLNFATTTIAGIIMFSTPKPKRASLKIAWRLNLLFTLCWTLALGAVGFGLSQVDWPQLVEMVKGWFQ